MSASTLKKSGFIGFIVVVLAIFLSANPVMAGTEVQLTSNLADQFDPYIFGDKIVWEDWRNANNPEIFMYDLPSSTEIRITDNSWGQYAPAMSMDKIFWTDFRIGNNRRDIYMYDLNTNTESRIVDAPGNQQAVGNQLTVEQASQLIAAAQRIISVL